MKVSQEQKIANLLLKEIDKQEIYQKEMAVAVNVSPQLLSHQLHGRRVFKLEHLVDSVEYVGSPDLDIEMASTLVGTPNLFKQKRKDGHPLTRMVNQDKEEKEREALEISSHIWELVSVNPEELTETEAKTLKSWLKECYDEISSELSVVNSVCNRFGFDSRSLIRESENRREGISC